MVIASESEAIPFLVNGPWSIVNGRFLMTLYGDTRTDF